jgi:hypothetical protein
MARAGWLDKVKRTATISGMIRFFPDKVVSFPLDLRFGPSFAACRSCLQDTRGAGFIEEDGEHALDGIGKLFSDSSVK